MALVILMQSDTKLSVIYYLITKIYKHSQILADGIHHILLLIKVIKVIGLVKMIKIHCKSSNSIKLMLIVK